MKTGLAPKLFEVTEGDAGRVTPRTIAAAAEAGDEDTVMMAAIEAGAEDEETIRVKISRLPEPDPAGEAAEEKKHELELKKRGFITTPVVVKKGHKKIEVTLRYPVSTPRQAKTTPKNTKTPTGAVPTGYKTSPY